MFENRPNDVNIQESIHGSSVVEPYIFELIPGISIIKHSSSSISGGILG
jgi:hypothetical protein